MQEHDQKRDLIKTEKRMVKTNQYIVGDYCQEL